MEAEMAYRIAVEDMEQNHWVAWALDLPGCFSAARTQEEAVIMAPTSISQYLTWLKNHGYRDLPRQDRIEIEVVEEFKSYVSDGMYVINAFFEDDKRPLQEEEVEFGIWLLDRTREDLGDVVETISTEKLNKSIPGEVQGSILGIIEHLAWSEWWYLDRIGLAFERSRMPTDPLMMVRAIRKHTLDQLAQLIDIDQITPSRGEYWSPRKVLRRTIWHERDHTNHIAKLRTYI
jgi:predicted RNase H-like HicB family nuclease